MSNILKKVFSLTKKLARKICWLLFKRYYTFTIIAVFLINAVICLFNIFKMIQFAVKESAAWGFLFASIGIALVIIIIQKIDNNFFKKIKKIIGWSSDKVSTKPRTSYIFSFDDNLTETDFYNIVKKEGKSIRRITNLYAANSKVYGTVRSQSGISEWHFKIDFNDYGELTGRYWILSDNDDSDIPKVIADRIAEQIENILYKNN